VLLGGVGLVWCAIFWPWFRNRPEAMRGVNQGERDRIEEGRDQAQRSPGKAGPIPWGRMLTSRSSWALCLAYGFGGFAGNFFVGHLPTYLADFRHLDRETTSWLTSLPMFGGACACAIGGILSDYWMRLLGKSWGRRVNGAIGLAVAGMAFVGTTFVRDPIVLAVLLTLTFTANDLAMGPAWAACADIGESAAGTLAGAMNMMANIGGAVAALVAGYYFQIQRPQWVFYINGASFGLAALCWLGVDASRGLAAKQAVEAEV
jgi:nitrate/nitrite transporter NarK